MTTMTPLLDKVNAVLTVVEESAHQLTDTLVGETGKVRAEVASIAQVERDELHDDLDAAETALTWLMLRVDRLRQIVKEAK